MECLESNVDGLYLKFTLGIRLGKTSRAEPRLGKLWARSPLGMDGDKLPNGNLRQLPKNDANYSVYDSHNGG